MKRLAPLAAVIMLSACGGGSTSTAVMNFSAAPTIAPSTPQPTSNPTSTPAPTPVAAPPTSGNPEASFQTMLNRVRLDNGADGVTYNARLDRAAQDHADDMLDNGYFSHTGRNGSSAGDRITAAGYQWRTYGENIASGHRSEESVLDGWVNSPGHQRNNINPNFEEFGLGYASGGGQTRWVLVLATER